MPELDLNRLPKHIAIIMDGNGRWAKKNGVTRAAGHEAGAKSVRSTVEACRELGGVEALTLYAFSTENWRRSKTEINALFRLFSKYLKLELDNLHEQGIRVVFSGRRHGLPQKTLWEFDECVEKTAENKAMTLNVAINYGGHAEIYDAAYSIARQISDGTLLLSEVNETLFENQFYQPELPYPDLLIRTSGEQRISNFLLYQLAYAELAFPSVLWPDFRKRHLHAAIADFQSKTRRFGGR